MATNRRMSASSKGRNRGESHLRGFAAMDPEKQREIASKGGRASHGGRGSKDRWS